MRKMISFKIENLPEKERKIVDDWANGQSNIQQSLANLIMHVVGFTGNADVMDFDVQRKLHTIFVNNEAPVVKQATSKPTQPAPEKTVPVAETNVYSNAADIFEED